MKLLKTLSNGLDTIILTPIIILLVIIFSPVIIVFVISIEISKLKDKRKLKKLIQLNNGQVYFVYADYNDYDFLSGFKEKYKDIICIKVNRRFENDLLVNYLTKDCVSKCYPSLIKIENDTLVVKEHYNSFKKLYKRESDIEAFFALIEKSINNLRKKVD